MEYFRDCHRIVVKVGTSTLTHTTGHLNLRRIEKLVKVLSDLQNSGIQVILVSSGAVSAGVAKVGFGKPATTEEKQAMASIGQSELMKIYDRFFSDYGHTVAQILMTKDVLTNPIRRSAAENTFNRLLEMRCIPIVNENDSVSTDELTKFGGNDILSAYVALLCGADERAFRVYAEDLCALPGGRFGFFNAAADLRERCAKLIVGYGHGGGEEAGHAVFRYALGHDADAFVLAVGGVFAEIAVDMDID